MIPFKVSLPLNKYPSLILYLIAFQYGTQMIIHTLNSNGHDIKLLICCGGLSKNSVYVQTHADVTGAYKLLLARYPVNGCTASLIYNALGICDFALLHGVSCSYYAH